MKTFTIEIDINKFNSLAGVHLDDDYTVVDFLLNEKRMHERLQTDIDDETKARVRNFITSDMSAFLESIEV